MPADTATPLPAVDERVLIWLLMAVQFINIVDFMMVMPLAPDFAAALGFPASSIGVVASAYSIASAIAGFIAALFLDQYSRKRALLFCLAGLSIATMACTLAWNLEAMVLARFIAGLFGGPMFGLCAAFVADYVPHQRRGAAMGKLMGAFSLGSILGVPFGLELAHMFDWRAPFFAIAALGLIVLAFGHRYLPYHKPFVEHEKIGKRISAIARMLQSKLVLGAYGCSAIAMLAGFLLIPNIAAFVQLNMGYPRDDLGLLYLVGGACTFFTQRLAGMLVDRTSATLTSIVFGIGFIATIYGGFVVAWAAIPVVAYFALFMIMMSGRGVAAQTLASKVPAPAQRASFMVVQGAVINIASSIGAYSSSLILSEQNGKLLHMETLGSITIALSLLVPFVFWYVERQVRGREH
jgi:predicted MFS family arabinose efflux permease